MIKKSRGYLKTSETFGFEDSLVEYCINLEGKIEHFKINGRYFTRLICLLVTSNGLKKIYPDLREASENLNDVTKQMA
jgi:hypothetical protein